MPTYVDMIRDIARKTDHEFKYLQFLIEATAQVFNTPIEYVIEDVKVERRKLAGAS